VRAPLQVKISGGASAQIEEAAGWWAENRPSAPGAIREDLGRILGLLSVQPGIGTPARAATLKDVRRVTLSRIRYYLYYRVAGDSLEVLALWHTNRGRAPDL
jgi:plasmid stabilization system protein ParE